MRNVRLACCPVQPAGLATVLSRRRADPVTTRGNGPRLVTLSMRRRLMSTQDQRTAVVTGGGTGLGRGITRALAADGYRVAVVGRRQEVLDLVAEETGAHVVVADLTDPTQVERAAGEIVVALGAPVDALVLNAGGSDRRPVETLAELAEHWSRTLSQNVLSAVLLEHALRPHLRRPGGRVVAVTSAAA